MTAEDLLRAARADLDRITPRGLAELRTREKVLVVDIRPRETRAAEGELPGAVPVERIVLEWRLDPEGEHRLPGVTADTRVVVVCNEGYASSLAAHDLRRLGLTRATDLVGGFRAWKSAGLPVVAGGGPPVP
ncbi:rhodanese-like domain-containing protein [Streptoalloteichus hindustanus]|uniref:Rhodanese-related sulfurtransferase n=1 Tax=Streptoalloteichus hindustanus TaxID=2017 RepID=A0A1M5GKA8_STRHI|nr:rhodanese-like domain-containing protein [Streptoalloteichus hindustanus]SHG04147.1 Rhodanese-related sulfurtransferase [Streptoalloteichus hindustanus]